MKKRLIQGLIGGAVLGLFCVIGACIRSGMTASPDFVFSLWYNRMILGLVIGAPWPEVMRGKAIARGALFGLIVSFAFYASTGFRDPVSFAAGIVYGIILEAWLSRAKRTAERVTG